MVVYPFIDSNIPSYSAYGVYMSQLIWSSRACNSNQHFLHRSVLLTRKLLNQGYIETKLRSTIKIVLGRYNHLALPYRVSVNNMTNDICMPLYCHEYCFQSLVCHRDIMSGTTRVLGTAYPFGPPNFTSGFHRCSCCPDMILNVLVSKK